MARITRFRSIARVPATLRALPRSPLQPRSRRRSRCSALRALSLVALGLSSGLLIGAARESAAEVEVFRTIDPTGAERYTIRQVPGTPADVGEAPPESPASPAEEAPTPERTAEPTDSEAAPQASDIEPGAPATSEVDAVSSAPAEDEPIVPGSAEDIRRQIERDREALREILTQQGSQALDNRNSTRLREIAERLPRLQAELEALENEPAP